MIRRKDLVDISDKDYDTRRNEFMKSQECGAELVGTQGDFFMMPMSETFSCPACGSENIALVKRVYENVIIKQ